MGINLWLAPQISEHCPKNTPERALEIQSWLIRPGMASIFTPKEGIVQEWITSADVAKKRTGIPQGIEIRLSTSKRRRGVSKAGSMYESNLSESLSLKLYLQYHWCPVIEMQKPQKRQVSSL